MCFGYVDSFNRIFDFLPFEPPDKERLKQK
jgi:hypothetical protein